MGADDAAALAPAPIRLDIVAACLKRDLPLLSLAYRNLQRFVPMKQLHVVTRRQDFPDFETALGSDAVLWDENEMIPGVTMEALKVIPMARFSQGVGWYFQQLLNYQFAFQKTEDDYYLIWDADTIPLRPMKFFDADGRMLLTKAGEFHAPYFETYERILGRPASREFSFIAQHMLIQKSILREMLSEIERHFPGSENWAWKIMRNLAGEGSNRFSEYETYGHYIKESHLERVRFRELPWLRNGASVCGHRPSEASLGQLGEQYYFASFEESERWYRCAGRRVRNWLRRMGKRIR